MTTFDERERSFENKFTHDEAFAFKVRARRSRLLAEWAYEQINSPEQQRHDDAVTFAANHASSSDDEILMDVASFIKKAGVQISFEDLRKQWENCDAEARETLAQG
jgi:hypothetical protein